MIRTILVVEDDNLMRMSLVQGLTAADYTVTAAQEGREGLAIALQDHPDLIVTDLMMPGMDGHSLLKALRKDEWGKHARVIILTGNEAVEAINEALQANVSAYFAKSEITIDDLIKQIAAMD